MSPREDKISSGKRLWWIAEECAEKHLDLYPSLVRSVKVVERGLPTESWNSDRIDVYVKSAREPGIDEYPLLQAILQGARGVRLEFFEYESIGQEMPRHIVLSRLIERSYRRRVPALVVMPSALPIALVEALSEPVQEILSSSLVAEVTVRYDNILYLPRRVRGPLELVAKRNSTSAYERVSWLRRRASERGLRIGGVTYLLDNNEIFKYVLDPEGPGFLERIPVNRLALYLSIASEHGEDIGVEIPISRIPRVERSSHLIYSLGVDPETLGGILLKVQDPSLLRRPVGLLHARIKSSLTGMYMRIFDRIIKGVRV